MGNTRQPNIYQFRTPQTYQAQGNNQQPNIRDPKETLEIHSNLLIGSSQELTLEINKNQTLEINKNQI